MLPVRQSMNRGTRYRAIPLGIVFSTGTAVGGLLTGAVVGLIAGLFGSISGGVAGALSAMAIAYVMGHVLFPNLPLPQRKRLIPQGLIQSRAVVGVFRFGLEYGSGVRTYVTSSAPYFVAIAAIASGARLGVCLVVGTMFGLSRSFHLWGAILVGRPVPYLRQSELLSRFGSRLIAPAMVGVILIVALTVETR